MNAHGQSSMAQYERLRDETSQTHDSTTNRLQPHTNRRLILALSAIGLAVVYLGSAPGNRAEADDSFMFASAVEESPFSDLVAPSHVRHLLYLPLMRAIFLFINWLHFDIRAYPLMNAVSVVAAVTGVVLFRMLLLRRFGCSQFVAAVSALGLAVSYGYWRYATEGDAYSVALVTVLLLCYVGWQDRLSLPAAALAGVLAALAVTVHILNLTATLVALPMAMLLARQWRQLVVYGTATLVAAVAITFGAYEFSNVSGNGYVDYVVFSGGDDTYEAEYSLAATARSSAGIGQTLLSGNFLFSYAPIAQRAPSVFPTKLLQDDLYFGQRAPAATRLMPPVLLTMLIALLLYLLLQLYGMRRSLDIARHGRHGRVVAVGVWGLAYWFIKVGREPADPESWIQLLPVMWIVAAVFVIEPLMRRRVVSRWIIVGAVALMAAHNFVGGLLPVLDESTDYYAQKARWLISNADPTDEIITADGAVFARYLDYYTSATVHDTRRVSNQALKDLLVGHDPEGDASIYATGDVLDPPSAWRADDRDRYRQHMTLLDDVGDSFVRVVEDEFGGIYEYVRE